MQRPYVGGDYRSRDSAEIREPDYGRLLPITVDGRREGVY
jgi:hypothetical protein